MWVYECDIDCMSKRVIPSVKVTEYLKGRSCDWVKNTTIGGCTHRNKGMVRVQIVPWNTKT